MFLTKIVNSYVNNPVSRRCIQVTDPPRRDQEVLGELHLVSECICSRELRENVSSSLRKTPCTPHNLQNTIRGTRIRRTCTNHKRSKMVGRLIRTNPIHVKITVSLRSGTPDEDRSKPIEPGQAILPRRLHVEDYKKRHDGNKRLCTRVLSVR